MCEHIFYHIWQYRPHGHMKNACMDMWTHNIQNQCDETQLILLKGIHVLYIYIYVFTNYEHEITFLCGSSGICPRWALSWLNPGNRSYGNWVWIVWTQILFLFNNRTLVLFKSKGSFLFNNKALFLLKNRTLCSETRHCSCSQNKTLDIVLVENQGIALVRKQQIVQMIARQYK